MDAPVIEMKDMDVKDIVSFLASEHKMIVRTEDQENDFWTKKQSEVVGEKLKEWATNMETKIHTLTKIERKDRENSLDYMERVFGDIDASKSQVSEELEALRKSSATEGGAAAEIQKQFDVFKKTKEKELSDLSGKVNSMEGDQFNNRIKLQVQDAMSKLRPGLKKDKENEKIVESAVENEINRFYSETKAIDHQGGLIYHNEKDEPIIDPVTGNHLGAFDILKTRLDYLIDSKRVQGGNGAGTPPPNGQEGGDKYKIELPDTVKTKIQLTDFLANDKKLDSNSEEFNKYFQENGASLPLR